MLKEGGNARIYAESAGMWRGKIGMQKNVQGSEPLVRTNESESRWLCGSPVCTSKRAMKPKAPALRASSASMSSDSWSSRASTLWREMTASETQPTASVAPACSLRTASARSAAGAAGAATGGTGGDPPVTLPHGFAPATVTWADAQQAYEEWKEVHLEDCGGGVWRVRWENARLDATVSEGIGYGMLLTVAHDEPAAFDGLLAYYHQALDEHGLMHWLRYGCMPTASLRTMSTRTMPRQTQTWTSPWR